MGLPEPAGEERLGRTRIDRLLELAKALFEGAGTRHLEVCVLQRAERGSLVLGHVRWASEPEILGACEPRSIRLLQNTMFGAEASTDGLMEMLGHMKPFEDDLAVGLRHMGACRHGHVGAVHSGDRLDTVLLFGHQRFPEAIQILLFPVLDQMEHSVLRQIRHHCQVPMLLGDGFSSTSSCGTTSWVRRRSPRATARFLSPQALSQVRRNNLEAPSGSARSPGSMASRSNQAVNCMPGSAHGVKQIAVPCTQMPLPAALPIIARAPSVRNSSRIGAGFGIDDHGYLFPSHIQFHVGHGPWGLEPRHGLIEFNVSHRSAPPVTKAPSIVQQESLTYTIS